MRFSLIKKNMLFESTILYFPPKNIDPPPPKS